MVFNTQTNSIIIDYILILAYNQLNVYILVCMFV